MQVSVAGFGDVRVEDGPNAISSLSNLAGTLAGFNFSLANIREIVEGVARQLPPWMTGGGPRIDSIVEAAMASAEQISRDPSSARRRRTMADGTDLFGDDGIALLTTASATTNNTPAAIAAARRRRAQTNSKASEDGDIKTSIAAPKPEEPISFAGTLALRSALTDAPHGISMRIGAASGAFKDVEGTQIVSRATSARLPKFDQTPLLPEYASIPKENLVCTTLPTDTNTSFKGCPLIDHHKGFQFSLAGPSFSTLDQKEAAPLYITSQSNVRAMPALEAPRHEAAPLMLSYQPSNAPSLEELLVPKAPTYMLAAPVFAPRG